MMAVKSTPQGPTKRWHHFASTMHHSMPLGKPSLLPHEPRLRTRRLIRASKTESAPVKPSILDPFGEVSADRGFLPTFDPPTRLIGLGSEWEDAVDLIPKLCVASGSGVLRRTLAALPPFPTEQLLPAAAQDSGSSPQPQLWRAYLVISFIAHAYMWCEAGPLPSSLPAVIAQPWAAVSRALGMPPVLVYATYNLLNWRRLDPCGPLALGNIVCLHNFSGGQDEEWFRLVHVAIEAQAAPAVAAILPMKAAAEQGDAAAVEAGLVSITAALQDMQGTLNRMGEKCDPYIYYQRVRQPMSGWKNNPALPGGLLYEGVSEAPLQYYGETGAQSSIVPAFDAALGIQHEQGWLQDYLTEMQQHMPPAHRAAIASFAAGPCIRSHAAAGPPALREAYNECVAQLQQFRSQHRAFAHSYIAKWAQKETTGTGGSDFMPALTGYRDTTGRHAL